MRMLLMHRVLLNVIWWLVVQQQIIITRRRLRRRLLKSLVQVIRITVLPLRLWIRITRRTILLVEVPLAAAAAVLADATPISVKTGTIIDALMLEIIAR